MGRRRKNPDPCRSEIEEGARLDGDGRLEFKVKFARCTYQGLEFGAGKCVFFFKPTAGMYVLACYAGECETHQLPVVAPEWLAAHGLPPHTAKKLCDTAMSQDHI